MLPWKNSWFQLSVFGVVVSAAFLIIGYSPKLPGIQYWDSLFHQAAMPPQGQQNPSSSPEQQPAPRGASSPPAKPSRSKTIQTFGDWEVFRTPTSTQMMTEINDAKTQKPIARVGLLRDGQKFDLIITLPLNTLLGANVAIRYGNGNPQLYQYQTCDAAGCVANGTVDEQWVTTFGKAQNIRLLFAGLDGKPLAIPLSSKGFDDAVQALTAN